MFTRSLIFALSVLLLTAGLAHAALLTQTVYGGSSFTADRYNNFSSRFDPAMFDPSLGTLVSVTVTSTAYEDAWTAYAQDLHHDVLTPNPPNPPITTVYGMNATVSQNGGLFTVTGPGVNAFENNVLNAYTDTHYLNGYLADYDWSGPAVANHTLAFGGVTNVNPSFFGAYTFSGPGTYNPFVNVVPFTFGGGTGMNIAGSTAGLTPDWYVAGNPLFYYNYNIGSGEGVSVTYTYETADAVPEPCTMTLLGLGVCGLGWRARRRKQTNPS